MNDPRSKWRFSVRAALLAALGLCVGFALIRAMYDGPDALMTVAAVIVVAGTLGTLIGMLSEREPMEGFVCGLLLVIVVGAIALIGLPIVRF